MSDEERCDLCGHPLSNGTHRVLTTYGARCTVWMDIDPAKTPRMDVLFGTVNVPAQILTPPLPEE